MGGLVGTTLGTLTVVGVSALRDWTPVMSPLTVAVAPLIGLVTGVLAGLYPAWRASRTQPAEALRRCRVRRRAVLPLSRRQEC